ncbi:cilia- and flagella-associated protein 43 [Cylas formicarius]|uniref:cilia- and flagella-associated protein 43 n=1 Tax=Cylas formicarius TaxID=197179 RepID=UPI002958D051|nr:cilia- and flagella-associated protein 43 [Cylas formicarius]
MKLCKLHPRWTKIGIIKEVCFMGRDIVLFSAGCFIQFIEINTGLENHLTVNNRGANGDGVTCVRGHPTLRLFAYAESCQTPNLYVTSYPDFQVVAKFSGGPKEGYKCLAFSETSLLFSLGEMPHYTVTAWNWRSFEKFAESNNELLYENQIIRCSSGRPMYLAQLGIGSNKLFIWDVFTVCKSSIFTKHEVKLGHLKPAPFEDIMWTMEGGNACYVIDRTGAIYTIDRDFFLELVIDFSTMGPVPTSLCWFNHGITVSGPNNQIRHYKKTGANWNCDWSFTTQSRMRNLICNKGEKMVAVSEMNEIVTLSTTEDETTFVTKQNSNFDDICLIYPCGQFAVALCNGNNLNVYNIKRGDLISVTVLDITVSAMAENPELPCVALGSQHGILQIMSFYNETKPTALAKFDLTDCPLHTVKYFETGNLLVAGNLDLGEFYVIKGHPGSKINVLLSVNAKLQVIDHFLVASSDVMRFFVLPVTSDTRYAGNQIIRYCIVNSEIVNVKTFECDDGVYYRGLIGFKGPDRDKLFYALPFDSRLIHLMLTKRGDPVVRVIEKIPSGHQLKEFAIDLTKHFAMSWSCCGVVIIRTNDFKVPVGNTLTHHRYLHGVKKARIDPSGTLVMSLGNEGVLCVTRLADREPDHLLNRRNMELKESTKYALMFKSPTICCEPEEMYRGNTWKDVQRLRQIAREEELCKLEKNAVWNEFKDIQRQLRELVTRNLEGPENEKIDLTEFYLDTALYNVMQQNNKEDCKRTETYLRCLIVAQDKVSDYLIKNYWDKMGVIWQQIHGFFSATKATKYCLLPEDEKKLKRLAWAEEQRKVEQFLTSQDSFEPWVMVSREKLLEILGRRPALPKEDYSGMAALRRLKELEDLDSQKSLETKIALDGSVSQLYINVSPGHYQQRQLVSFYQCDLQQAVAEQEVTKLKFEYNKCFDNMRAVKEREMYNIKEKNARLRHILSEYNYFSETKVHVDIVDPEWSMTENPTTVLSVAENEISIRPYISPSEQAILDAKRLEEERVRRLLMADDFRERALMAMMNGVLEVRWEDELKKDVPKPNCMIEKSPEDYNEDDLRAVRDYEIKVVQLNVDREKYKSLLETEFSKLSTGLRDSIRKFNRKLYECTKFKFYIDSGMNQENLQVNRARVNQNLRIEIDEKERNIIQTIKQYENAVDENLKIIAFMQEALAECKTNLENMQIREKALEKAYRKDFQAMSPVVQEQAIKYYRKRPKANLRIITTATLMYELAKGIISNERTVAMTQECIDYMNALEQIDSFSPLLPAIDEHTWALICKHRRQRIEFEVKVRAAQIQSTDGEATIATFHKRVVTQREKIAKLNEDLEQTRADRLHLMHNKQVQVVLRRGLVEIPLTGDIFTDFSDAILVPRKEIEEVNNLIVNAGELKLKTITQNMSFRRRVMQAEWEHMKLRMEINDHIEQKKDVENVKFTKEMQTYLKNKSLGRKTETESYEMEIELITATYENKIKDRRDKYIKMKKQIKAYKESTERLDKTIGDVNMDVCLFKIEKDNELEAREKEIFDARMKGMLKRSALVKRIQQNHNEILVLQTELELLRLRTFPTFKYKVIRE